MLPSPAPAIAGGSVNATAPATPMFNISYVPPPSQIRSSELQPLPPSLQPPPPPLPPSQSSPMPSAVTLPRPHTKPQRISDRTRSKTVKPRDQGLHYSVGLLSTMSKNALLSMVTTEPSTPADATRRQVLEAAGSRHFPLGTAMRHHRLGGAGGSHGLCSPPGRTSKRPWATNGRHKNRRTCHTVTPLTSRYQGATRRLCDRSTLIFGSIRRGGNFMGCWMRGLLTRVEISGKLNPCNVDF